MTVKTHAGAEPMNDFDIDEANLIANELRRLYDELEQIRYAGDRLKYSRDKAEISHFSQRLRVVKDEIKEYAYHRKLDKNRRGQTQLESAFFEPAVTKAHAYFNVRKNAPPSKWLNGLCSPSSDLQFCIFQLEDIIKKSKPDHEKSPGIEDK